MRLPLGEREHAFGVVGWQSLLKGKLQLTYLQSNAKQTFSMDVWRMFLATLAMNADSRNFPRVTEQGWLCV